MSSLRLLGVFAHPDDEVFCAGGTLAKYAAEGAETTVVSATRGEAGQIRDSTVASRATLGAVREKELRSACAALGVKHVEFLDHVDTTLSALDQAALADEVATVIRYVDPDVVITFGPDGAYGHPDHVAIGNATTDAFNGIRHGRLYHSHFARSRLILADRLARWLVDLKDRFRGPEGFVKMFSIFTRESATLGYAADQINIAWFPPGEYILEQNEPATSLHLILSGNVEIAQDQPDGSRKVLRRQGPGEFFGELGLVEFGRRRTAHVIAVDSVTCMVLSYVNSMAYDPRGAGSYDGAHQSLDNNEGYTVTIPPGATTMIDVCDYVDRKIAAIASHHTQYPIDPEMFPSWMLKEMLGQEYFVRVYPEPDVETDLFGRT